MRRGYTLIEIIITIAITAILAIGMFKALEAITLRSEKAKALSTLSLDSQSALDQISLLLYNRAPNFLTACKTSIDCVPFDEIIPNKTILQWYGIASESHQDGNYSGFVDMNQSHNPNLYTPDTYFNAIKTTQTAKWGSFDWGNDDIRLIFAGTFDSGDSNSTYKITMTQDYNLNFTNPPAKIYEKYYLVDSAYAVTRKEDAILACPVFDFTPFKDNDLLLFYNYRPWKGQTFCNAQVTVLAENTSAFRAQMLNGTIRLAIDMNRSIRGSSNPVHLSKQKVVF
jgi:prepilin-type N-terminal cleavage/methylation domain-containing protein